MALNRRAVFFTLSSILFVTAMLLVFTADFTGRPVDTNINNVASTNAFRQKLENTYLPTIVRHYSYQTIQALAADAYNEAGTVYLSMPSDFQSAVMDGTYSGNPASTRTVDGLTTLPAALASFSATARQLGYNVTINVTDISVRQTGAFTALAEANITYNLSSQDGSVRFDRSIAVATVFDLYYLPDLYYNNRNTFGEYNTIQYTAMDGNTAFNAAVLARSLYGVNNESPSYFDRLMDIGTASPYGIETTIPATAPPAGNLTVIDWQYFQGRTYECIYENATNMDPDIHVESDTATLYQLNVSLVVGVSSPGCPPYLSN